MITTAYIRKNPTRALSWTLTTSLRRRTINRSSSPTSTSDSTPRTRRCAILDMLIQGGRVVTPAGVGDWDVGIVGEKIVSVAFPGVLPAEANQVIDAPGNIVV